MSIFDRLFGRRRDGMKYAQMLNGFAPIYSQFGTNIFASDVVQQSISCIASEMSKLRPMHIRRIKNDSTPIRDRLQKVLEHPNSKMTKSDFIEKVTWLLYLNFNAFIIPTWFKWTDEKGIVQRRLAELYPINPSCVTFLQDASESIFVQFDFTNGKSYTIPYERVIHIKHHFGVNEFMGGDESGQPDNSALLQTLQMNKNLLESVAKSVNSSMAINGIIKYNTMLDKGKIKQNIADLEALMKEGKSGVLPLDIGAEYIPINKNVALVDDSTLRFVDEKILRHFGVPLSILKGDFTKGEYAAFYQKTLEPLVCKFGEAFTRVLLSQREKDLGQMIEFLPKELVFMDVQQTIEMVTLLSNTGAITENEKRMAFGLPPLEELEGKRYISLNWIDTDDAKAYQVGQEKGDPNDE